MRRESQLFDHFRVLTKQINTMTDRINVLERDLAALNTKMLGLKYLIDDEKIKGFLHGMCS